MIYEFRSVLFKVNQEKIEEFKTGYPEILLLSEKDEELVDNVLILKYHQDNESEILRLVKEMNKEKIIEWFHDFDSEVHASILFALFEAYGDEGIVIAARIESFYLTYQYIKYSKLDDWESSCEEKKLQIMNLLPNNMLSQLLLTNYNFNL
jgi:hypothetical protein